MRPAPRWLLGSLLAGSVILGWNVWQAAQIAATYPHFWQGQAAQPIRAGAVRLTALGDSTILAVGASTPLLGVVGRAARHVTRHSGRPVHINNVSSGGATIGDLFRTQLPRVDLTSDLLLVSSASDLERRVPLAQYRRDLETLLSALPAARTVLSDLPLEPRRAPYQAVLAQVADAHGVRRADFALIFGGAGRRLDVFSILFPHLNDRGYGLWFEAFRPAIDQVMQGWPGDAQVASH